MITKKQKTYIARLRVLLRTLMSLTKFSRIADKMLFNFCQRRTSVAKLMSNGI